MSRKRRRSHERFHRPPPRAEARPATTPAKVDPDAIATWARRFKRVGAVLAIGGLPSDAVVERLVRARRSSLGVPREALAALPAEAAVRLNAKPFVALDLPDAGLARLARTETPRVPSSVIVAAVHALAIGAPVILDAATARAATPLVACVVARPTPATAARLEAELQEILKAAALGVADGMKLVPKSGAAFLEIARGVARDRTITSKLDRLVGVRRRWIQKDAAKRFGALVENQVGLGEATHGDWSVAYLDLLPLFIARMGAGGELAQAFERPLAHLALGVVPAVVLG